MGLSQRQEAAGRCEEGPRDLAWATGRSRPPSLAQSGLHLGCEAFSVSQCLGGCPGCPHPLLSVCGVGGPTPASCQSRLQWSRSSQIVFSLGWWPCQCRFLRSLWREIPETSRYFAGAFCLGSCSSVRNKVPNKHVSALLTSSGNVVSEPGSWVLMIGSSLACGWSHPLLPPYPAHTKAAEDFPSVQRRG